MRLGLRPKGALSGFRRLIRKSGIGENKRGRGRKEKVTNGSFSLNVTNQTMILSILGKSALHSRANSYDDRRLSWRTGRTVALISVETQICPYKMGRTSMMKVKNKFFYFDVFLMFLVYACL